MKTLKLLAMVFLMTNEVVSGQPPIADKSNLSKIMQFVKVDETEKYTINEALQLRIEAGNIAKETRKMLDDLIELRKISSVAQNFSDIKRRAVKKAEKTECRILQCQTDALETYELSNDIIHAFYKSKHKEIFPDVDNASISLGNRKMKEAEVLWESAKEMRNNGYRSAATLKSVEYLIKAQKLEECAIATQEEALSLLLGFGYSEPLTINYSLFEIPDELLKGCGKSEVDKLLASSDTVSASNITEISEEQKGFDDDCNDDSQKIVMYKIQIGAFIGKANEAAFRGISPISTERTESGFTRYLAGEYKSYDVAEHALNILKNIGFKDAFIVTYVDDLRLGPEIRINGNDLAKKM